MTYDEIVALYDRLMYSGQQTVEKHVRWAAEQIVKDAEGGFSRPILNVTLSGDEVVIPWQVGTRRYVDVHIVVPPGMHGFALQMVIEAQIKEQVA